MKKFSNNGYDVYLKLAAGALSTSISMSTTGIREKCSIESWNRFVTRGLAVSPELMGRSHKFEYDGHKVEIRLPEISKVEEHPDRGVMATLGARRAADNEPLEYQIHQVDIRVNKSQVLFIDPETFNRNPVAYDLYTEQERNEFENICDEHEDLAKRSFEYWLSVLRWLLDDYRIGRVEMLKNNTGWSTYLEDSEGGRTVWIQRGMFVVEGYRVVKLSEWDSAQTSLEKKETPPVYISLKHDAEESMSHGDYIRSIIELAMSCEIFLRFVVLEKLPKDLQDNFVKVIEELNINQYVTKHFRKLVSEADLKEYRKLSFELSSLFDKRSKILHMGKSDGATKRNCIRFLVVTTKLIEYKQRIVGS